MNSLKKEVIRDDIYHAIKKVLNAHRDNGNLDTLTTESTEVLMTNAAMLVLEVTEDAVSEWTDSGYLKS